MALNAARPLSNGIAAALEPKTISEAITFNLNTETEIYPDAFVTDAGGL